MEWSLKEVQELYLMQAMTFLTQHKNYLQGCYIGKYTSNSGDSGGIVYALTKATNTRYTVGINLGSITYNGVTYGACIKAYLINQTFGLTRY